MDLELKGRTALVTGASVGIGRAIARLLAAEGATVAVAARREQLLIELADEVEAAGDIRPLVVAADLARPGVAVQVRDRILAEFGRLDILVNNAGGSRSMSLDAPESAWDEAFAINFTAIRHLTHAFLPGMQQQQWGRIVNITGSSEPKNLNAANAAKAAVHAWAKGVSLEVGRQGITINSIAPGRIMSEQIMLRVHPTAEERARVAESMIPLGYFGEPEDLAPLVALLASPKGRYITGELFHVDGGMKRYAF